jgi:hypothetical protein
MMRKKYVVNILGKVYNTKSMKMLHDLGHGMKREDL